MIVYRCLWHRRWLLSGALAVLLVLTGCADLNTDYGDRMQNSINGLRVLQARFRRAFQVNEVSRLSPALGDQDVIIHVAPYHGVPGAEGMQWLTHWLESRARRQAIIFLRDGSMTPWLCRHWADQLRKSLPTLTATERVEAERDINRLLERAAFEDEPEAYFYGGEHTSSHFSVSSRFSLPTSRFSGLIEAAAPPFLNLRNQLTFAQGTVLQSVDDQPFIIDIPVGRSRLLVVASTLPFLDAAQVDPVCRRLLNVIIIHMAGFSRSRAAWVRNLSVSDIQDQPPLNIITMLFARPPFSFIVWHALLLVVVFMATRAYWLGRTEATSQASRQRFSRHIEAFAYHLRRQRAHQVVIKAMAAVLRRPMPGRIQDPLVQMRAFYDAGVAPEESQGVAPGAAGASAAADEDGDVGGPDSSANRTQAVP